MELIFVTCNQGKFEEAKHEMEKHSITLNQVCLDLEEKRGTLEEIAIQAAKDAYGKIRKPLFVDDTGIFIEALNGFPGEFSAWIYKKIGAAGVLKLLENQKNRSAYFKTIIAYNDGKTIRTFEGICEGTISNEPRGNQGFAYDVIFIPKGQTKTNAQDIEMKRKVSHRKKVIESFLEFILS